MKILLLLPLLLGFSVPAIAHNEFKWWWYCHCVEACEELDKPKPIEEGEVNGQTSPSSLSRILRV